MGRAFEPCLQVVDVEGPHLAEVAACPHLLLEVPCLGPRRADHCHIGEAAAPLGFNLLDTLGVVVASFAIRPVLLRGDLPARVAGRHELVAAARADDPVPARCRHRPAGGEVDPFDESGLFDEAAKQNGKPRRGLGALGPTDQILPTDPQRFRHGRGEPAAARHLIGQADRQLDIPRGHEGEEPGAVEFLGGPSEVADAIGGSHVVPCPFADALTRRSGLAQRIKAVADASRCLAQFRDRERSEFCTQSMIAPQRDFNACVGQPPEPEPVVGDFVEDPQPPARGDHDPVAVRWMLAVAQTLDPGHLQVNPAHGPSNLVECRRDGSGGG